MNSNTAKSKFGKLTYVLFAVLTVILYMCFSAVFISAHGSGESSALNESDIIAAVQSTTAYNGAETVISIDKDIEIAGDLNVESAKIIRITGKNKLVFAKSLTVASEAHVILDVETEFKSGSSVRVDGTLTVNGILSNNGEVTVNNKRNALDDYPSDGILVNGSFNNDATNGRITISDGSTFEIAANSDYAANGAEGINANGGALFLKGTDGLGISGGVLNKGSVFYDGDTAPSLTAGSNAAVKATFTEATQDNLSAAAESGGTHVFYPGTGEASISRSVTFNKAVNLLAFGRVTFKLTVNNVSFSVNATNSTVALGGGTNDGVYFTQGANELIFDGGANWTKDGDSEYSYGGATSPSGTTVFYDENNRPYKYKIGGIENEQNAFFTVSGGTLAMYGGTKITEYARTGTANISGGGISVGSGTTLNMYGGEVSRCAVTQCSNGTAGGGIYSKSGTINLFGGSVTHNALGNYGTCSADGAGISIIGGSSNEPSSSNPATLNMYGGEVSYNHGALEYSENGADGGGVMLNYSIMNMFGGEVRGNYAGGGGGGVGLWVSDFTMTGGTIAENHGIFGGGVGAIGWTGQRKKTTVVIRGGSIVDNNAFQNYAGGKNPKYYGGYGGGICVGSSDNPSYAQLTVSGNTLISGNKAYYGGGLAVYTNADTSNSNQLNMSGGLITGNAAYVIPSDNKESYSDAYETAKAELGGGVYVNNAEAINSSRYMLSLSGDASIDSSNSVSFSVRSIGNNYAAPIAVTDKLTGSGLGALVCLTSPSTWSGKNVISFDDFDSSNDEATLYLNKFVLDNAGYTFGDYNRQYIQLQSTASATSYVARIGSNRYSTLSDAIAAANGMTGDVTIEILKSATLTHSYTIGKNITVQPASGKDVSLVLAAEANLSSAVFIVNGGSSLTLNGSNGSGSRLTIDGNGTGRKLKSGSTPANPFVEVKQNGALLMKGDVYLRNNLTDNNVSASAVIVSSSARFEMQGGVIEDNVSEYATGSAVYCSDNSTFTWTGGAIRNNTTSAKNATVNYGVYLSSSSSNMNVGGMVKLEGNVIYSDAAKIVVNSDFDTAQSSEMQIVLPAVSTNMTAGKELVFISKSADANFYDNVSKKFKVESTLDGLSTGTVQNTDETYPHRIVVYRTTTYILDASKDGIEFDGDLSELAELIETSGAAEVKFRSGGKVLVIKVRSNREVSVEGLAAVSDFFTLNGYTIMGWTDNSGTGHSYSETLKYDGNYVTSLNPITYVANWTPNVYEIAFDVNAPKDEKNNQAAVGGSVSNTDYSLTYEDIDKATTAAEIPSNSLHIIGFVFSGWKSGNKTVFSDGKVALGDIAAPTATATRGRYRLEVKAEWTGLFGSESDKYVSIGCAAYPFIIETEEHLERLAKTVNGEQVGILDNVDNIFYNYYNGVDADGGLVFSASDYEGYNFKLAGNVASPLLIGSQATPFGGTFDGNNKTVALNGKALFGYLKNAVIKNVNLSGSVDSSGDHVGALAEIAEDGSITNVGNLAEVSATATAGGIVGKAVGVTFLNVFNAGAIDGATAGGIVGESQNGNITVAFNSANISGDTVGGVIGKSAGSSSVELRRVYNTGKITSTAYAGGVVGLVANTGDIGIFNSFNGGAFEGDGATAGAIVGKTDQSISFTNVYYNTDKTDALKAIGEGSSGSSNAIALTSSQMYVNSEGAKPKGMGELQGDWVYIYGGTDNRYYYPQHKVFAENTSGVGDTNVAQISANGAELTVKSGQPLTPEQTFTVLYKLNGGNYIGDLKLTEDGSALTATVKFAANATVTEPKGTLSKTGYDFDAWYIDEACTRKYDFASGVSAADLTLYANWTAHDYVLYYGLALEGEHSASINLNSGKVKLPDENNAKRVGYNFQNWEFTDNTSPRQAVNYLEIVTVENELWVYVYSNDEIKFEFKLSEVENNNISLNFEAVWTPVNYTIAYKYYDNAGNPLAVSAPSNPETYTIETQASVAFVKPALAGYDFVGWVIKDADDFDARDIPKENLSITYYPPRNCYVYGVFAPKTYKVAFDPGYGVLAKKSGDTYVELTADDFAHYGLVQGDNGLYAANVVYNKNHAKLNEIGVLRQGYVFGGWFISRNPADGELPYDFDTLYTYTNELTIFNAKLTVMSFTVSVKVDENKGYFSQDQFTEENFKKITITSGDSSRFYSYNITVDYGKSGYALLVSPITLNSDTSFGSWKNFNNIIDVEQDAVDDERAVTAQFDSRFSVVFLNSYDENNKLYTVTVDSTGATTTLGDVKKGENYIEPAEIKGYRFEGWFYVSNNVEATDEDELLSACVLYAKYSPAQVEITCETNDPVSQDKISPQVVGNLNFNYDQTFTLENLPAATYEKGYAFAGWFVDAACTESAVGKSIAALLADKDEYKITLYAKWTATEYKISYTLNASDAVWGENKPRDSYTYIETFGAGISIPVIGVANRTGYTLTGWSGTDNNKIKEGSTGALVLVAVWTPNTYTVTFTSEEGEFTVPESYDGKYYAADGVIVTSGTAVKYEIPVTYGSAAVAPDAPTRVGYAFAGWDSSLGYITSAVTVKATYRANRYSLHLVSEGTRIVQREVGYSSPLPVDGNVMPTRKGYTFVGWYDKAEGGADPVLWIENDNGTLITDKTMPANDLTLYAHWSINSYDISFVLPAESAAEVGEFITGKLGAPTSGNTYTVEYGTDLTGLNGGNTGEKAILFYIDENNTTAYTFTTASEDITLYVALTDSVAKVTFDYGYDIGSGETTKRFSYRFGAPIAFFDLARDGYTFLGWFDGQGDDATEIESANAPEEGGESPVYYAKWSIKTYGIVYVLNGGDNNASNPATYDVETPTIELQAATRSGYTFVGWFNGEGAGATAVTEIAVGSTGDKTLFAHWTAKRYKITVVDYTANKPDAESGEETSVREINLTYGGDAAALKALWSRDYHSVALYFDSEYTDEFGRLSVDKVTALDENNIGKFLFDETEKYYSVTLYAKYTKISYDVVYYSNGNTADATGNGAYVYGGEYAIVGAGGEFTHALQIAPPAGNTHIGWKVKIGNQEVVVKSLKFNFNGNGNVSLVGNNGTYAYPVGEIKLYPEYETTLYTVSFELNGGSGSMASFKFEYGKYAAIDEYDGAKVGHTFAGWATSANDATVKYANGAMITSTDGDTNIVLYAVWIPVTYTVRLWSESSVLFTSYNVNLGDEIDLLTPSRPGYTFKGWKLNGDKVDQKLSIDASVIPSDGSATIEVIAEWTATVYKITYVLNGGKNDAANPATYTVASSEISLAAAERNGYTFLGWFDGIGDSAEKVEKILKGSTRDYTLHAKWDIKPYNIAYDLDGGVNDSSNPATYDVEKAVVLKPATRTGYTFMGWYTDSEFADDSKLESIPQGTVGNYTLHAKWEKIAYGIIYVLNGGENNDANPETYYVDSETITLKGATLAGHDFDGWYTDAACSPQNKITEIVKGSTSNYILYAHWTVQTFTVKVNAGEGTFVGLGDEYTVADNTVIIAEVSYGSEIYSKLYRLQKSLKPDDGSKSFLVWSTSATEEQPKDSFLVTSDITVYAFYSADKVGLTIIFVDGTSTVQIVGKGDTFTSEAIHSLGNVAHDHTGYNDDTIAWVDLEGNEWTGGSFDQSSTLVESLPGLEHVVTLDADGGTTESGSLTVTYGGVYGALPTPTRTGYTFLGWYYGSVQITAETVVDITEDVRFVAKWSAKYYTAVFADVDGAGAETSMLVQYAADAKVTVPDAARLGFALTGWKVEGIAELLTGTVELSAVAEHAVNDTVTFTAQWERREYTLTYMTNGGNLTAGSADRVSFNADSDPKDITLPTLEKVGYTFNGWIWKAGSNEGTVESTVQTVNVDRIIVYAGDETSITISADWTVITYNITYVLGGGTNGDNPTAYTVETETITLDKAERACYLFDGWYSEATFENRVEKIAKPSAGNKTLYAKWEALTYKIKFDNAGYSDSDASKTVTAAQNNGKVSLPTPSKTGFTFGGWTIDEISDVFFNNSVSLTAVYAYAKGVDREITFKAVWSNAAYRIDYALSGGRFNSDARGNYVHNERITVPNPVKDNYVFTGWIVTWNKDGKQSITVEPNEGDDECEFNGGLMNADISLEAQWVRETKVLPEIAIENKDYLQADKIPTVGGVAIDLNKYAVLYGTPILSLRTSRSVSGFAFGKYEWSEKPPVNAGKYVMLVYYKFDGDATPRPNDESDTNGWAVTEFTVAKIDNSLTLGNVTVTYGEDWHVSVSGIKEDAAVELVYYKDGLQQSGKPTGAGEYTVIATSAETANYLRTSSVEATVTILRAPITVTCDAKGTYGNSFDGAADYTYSGFVGGDTASVISGVPLFSIESAERLAVGEYALDADVSGLKADNYYFRADCTYTVEKRAIEVTICDVEAQYGTDIDLSSVAFTAEGLVNGDTLETAVRFFDLGTTAQKDSPVNGIYPITCDYESENYVVTFKVGSGYYKINRLQVDLIITATDGDYGDGEHSVEITGLRNTNLDDERKAEILATVKESARFVYAGATFNGEVYQTPAVMPSQAGVYYATVLWETENYSLLTSSVQFTINKKVLSAVTVPSAEFTGKELTPEIEPSEIYSYPHGTYVDAGEYPITFTIKDEYFNNYQWAGGRALTVIFKVTPARNGLVQGEVSVKGWTYGGYDASVNAPVSSAAKFGTITYTYSTERNGIYVASVPSSGAAGTYWVRAEVAGTGNYEAFISEPVSFEIAKAVLNAPALSVVTSGEGKNDVYTGDDLYSSVLGYDPTIMRIAYDGTLVADVGQVTVVARTAGSRVVKFTLIDTRNYRWADGTEIDGEGNAFRTWTVAKAKVAIPLEPKEPFTLDGFTHVFIPEGFDSSIMNIEGNSKSFAGSYKAIITLKDPDNYEWENGTTGEIVGNWQIVGINKVFVAIVTVIGGLALVAASFAVAQLVIQKKNKKQSSKAMAERSAEASEAGAMTPVDAEANHGEHPVPPEEIKESGNKKAKKEKNK